MSAGKISRELQWTSQEFSAADIFEPWVSMLTYHLGMKKMLFRGSSSET
jgi:hypothetical protein